MSKPLPVVGSAEMLEESEAKARDVAERGPRLTYGGIYLAAKCHTGKHELHGGLGAMGVGHMWFEANPDHVAAPEWETLPVATCSGVG